MTCDVPLPLGTCTTANTSPFFTQRSSGIREPPLNSNDTGCGLVLPWGQEANVAIRPKSRSTIRAAALATNSRSRFFSWRTMGVRSFFDDDNGVGLAGDAVVLARLDFVIDAVEVDQHEMRFDAVAFRPRLERVGETFVQDFLQVAGVCGPRPHAQGRRNPLAGRRAVRARRARRTPRSVPDCRRCAAPLAIRRAVSVQAPRASEVCAKPPDARAESNTTAAKVRA